MSDSVSENRILKLHPKIRDAALNAYREAVRITPIGIHPFITESLRSFEESNELYEQGRTKPGSIVTNAKAGQSYHNYGLAFDFVIQNNGHSDWNVNDNWMKVVNTFKNVGFAWGGDFHSIKDFPHLENRLGYNWRDLLVMYNEGKFIEGTKYVDI